jgi:hypothetical protein
MAFGIRPFSEDGHRNYALCREPIKNDAPLAGTNLVYYRRERAELNAAGWLGRGGLMQSFRDLVKTDWKNGKSIDRAKTSWLLERT